VAWQLYNPQYLAGDAEQRPRWLRWDRLLGNGAYRRTARAGRGWLAERMEVAGGDLRGEFKAGGTGRCLGGRRFGGSC